MKMKHAEARVFSLKLADTALWFLAALHTLAALSLIVLLTLISPADAKEDFSCGGHNVIADIQKNDPKGFAELQKETAELKNGESVFWKIEKPGIAPSYLLGTMHISDPRVVKLPTVAKDDFEAAKSVIVESDEIADKKKAQAILMARPDLTMFTNGKSIYDYINDDQKKRLDEALKERGIPLAVAAKMKPYILSSYLALPTCELKRKAAGAEFLDEKLTKEAIADGKHVVGLETMAEQLEAMASVPMKTHVAGLISVLKDPELTKNMMETLIELYHEGKPAMIGPLGKYFDKKGAGGVDIAEFEKTMIVNRNHHMADRAAATLDKGNAFMAVGALHLPGPEGLVALFREKGFTVTAVKQGL
jgi:hypothetical protein